MKVIRDFMSVCKFSLFFLYSLSLTLCFLSLSIISRTVIYQAEWDYFGWKSFSEKMPVSNRLLYLADVIYL